MLTDCVDARQLCCMQSMVRTVSDIARLDFNLSLFMQLLAVNNVSNPVLHCMSPAGVSYQLAPRAKISRRDQGTVANLHDLKLYMRSNSWRSDPLSGGTAFGAICGRGDINPKSPKASGCIDAKVNTHPAAHMYAACA